MKNIPTNTMFAASRYIPFTRQNYCGVPAGIQMIMYRLGIPLVSAEELGYHMGLTVPPEDARLFSRVRVSDIPPSDSGYGTLISSAEYNPNKAFEKLDIPLIFRPLLASQIASEAELLAILQEVESKDADALLCFNSGVIQGEFQPHTGKVVVFDKIIDGKVQIVDPSPLEPKNRLLDVGSLYEAIKQHGDAESAGVWHITRP